MASMGLDGRARTAWRSGSGGDAGAPRDMHVKGRVGLEGMLRRQGKPEPMPASMSAEQFTLRKEQHVRDQGVDIVSIDRDYKPAVHTWGVFDRPSDISKAYGGGRNLKPEDSTMTAEEQAAYDKRLQEKLAAFRQNSGLVVDPGVAAKCEALTAQGKILLDRGNLQGALALFSDASHLVNPKTDVGGQALLHKAITLDSIGNNEEALTLYRQLRTHRSTYVAKTARAMSFGFQAGEFLKADTISYAAKQEEYDPFFTTLRGKWGWDTVYIASDEEKAESSVQNRVLTAVALFVMSAPLLFIAYVYF